MLPEFGIANVPFTHTPQSGGSTTMPTINNSEIWGFAPALRFPKSTVISNAVV
jgi:hypothetical protein